jgi:hypothetical protein
MNARLALIFVVTLLNLISCSGDKTDKQDPKPQPIDSTMENIEEKPTISSRKLKNSKDLKSDLHLSGSPNAHVSGVPLVSENISGN